MMLVDENLDSHFSCVERINRKGWTTEMLLRTCVMMVTEIMN